MGQDIVIVAPDGHRFSAYRADPARRPRAVVIVLHELLGLTPQIRQSADRFAGLGYTAIAPNLYDRVAPGSVFVYSPDGIQKGREVRDRIGHDTMMVDIQGAIDFGRDIGPVAAIGYCMGGSLAFLATTRLTGLACGIGYYGNLITRTCEETPKAPCMLHYGERDVLVPPADIEKVRRARPEIEIFVYAADHGFDCDGRHTWDPAAAKLALERSLGFLYRHAA